MDLDLDLFERRGSRRRPSARRGGERHRDDDWEYDERHEDHRRGRSRGGYARARGRRAHPHLFAWALLGGGALLFGLAVIAIAASFGLWGYISDAYFALSYAVLPTAWHDEWAAIPGVAHVALVLGALFVAAGVAGEVFD
jgi:hypothetical protein